MAQATPAFLNCPAGWPSRNLFPIAFSQNGLLNMEKRDC